ncbi:MAG: PD-(D/E)XK nuclease family protein, partial [Patescibacteria group bacterium]
EGKAALFKRFADIDAWPLCLDTQDVDEIVRTVQLVAPVFGGIVCGTFQGRTGRFILERKTTDQGIESDSSYWNRLLLNHQLDEYALAYWQKNGTTIDGIVYDVLRQPGISPRKITIGELNEISADRTYFGATARESEIAMAAEFLMNKEAFSERKKLHTKERKKNPDLPEFTDEPLEQPTETPHLFFVRCMDYLRDKGNDFFAQRFVPKSEPEILAYAAELWTLSDLMGSCETLESSPRNPSQCFNFQSTCEYVGLCTGTESEDAAKWDRKPEVKIERLSQSRISCFQNCRRKHYYRHVAGIVPVVRPSSEKQSLGLLVHKALEILWQVQQPKTS